MQNIWPFLVAHQVVIVTGLWWVFSAFMSSVPPLPPDAGWWAKTFYGFFQKVAANRDKQPSAVPGGPAVEVPSVQPVPAPHGIVSSPDPAVEPAAKVGSL